jgi:hypothetical protein
MNNASSHSHRNMSCVSADTVNLNSTDATLTLLALGSRVPATPLSSSQTANLNNSVTYLTGGLVFTVTLPDAQQNGILLTFVLQAVGAVTIHPTTPGIALDTTLVAANESVTYIWCGLPLGWSIMASTNGLPPPPTVVHGVSGHITNPVGNISTATDTQLTAMNTVAESWYFNTSPIFFDDATGNYTITISGFYMLQARVTFDNTGTNGGMRSIFALLNANPALVIEYAEMQASANGLIDSEVQFSGVVLLSAGSIVSFWVYQDSGATISLIASNDSNRFGLFKLS